MKLPLWSWTKTLASLGYVWKRSPPKTRRHEPHHLQVEALEARQLLTASPLYWDPDGVAGNNVVATGAGLGGSGNWDTSSALWYDPISGNDVVWSSSAQAVFKGTAGTVTANSGLTTDSLVFSTTGYAVQSGSLGLSGAETIDVGSGLSETISTQLTGSGGLTKTSTGTLILSGANTFTGSTAVSAGTLNLSNSAALQNSTLTTAGVAFDSSVGGNAFTLGGLSGSSNLALQNNAGSPAAIALSVGNNDANTTYSGVLSAGGSLTKVGSGTLTLTGSNSYTGTTTISGGTLKVGGGSTTGTLGTGTVTDNATLEFNRSNSMTVSVVISGSGSLTQSGSGTLILTGSNTYSGGTAITAGTLQIGNATTTGSLGSGAVVDDAALVYFLIGSATVANAISGSGTLTESGNGSTLILTGANTYSGGTTINGLATLQVGNAGTTGTIGSGTITAGSAFSPCYLVFGRSDALTVGNTITGNINLTHQGAGTLTLSGTNTYSGGTTINVSRTLKVGNSSALGTGTTTVNGTLDLNGNDTTLYGLSGANSVTSTSAGTITLTVGAGNANTVFSGVIQNGSGTVALTKVGSGKLTFEGNNTYTGGTTISAGTLQVGNSSSTGSLSSGAVVDDASLIFARSGSTTIANAISGSGTLTQQGSGTLILTGTNTYSGGTTISGGTLQVGSGSTTGSIGSGGITDNATLAYNRSNSVSLSNVISGTGAVTQQGSGTLTLTGTNTYSGGTTINASSTLQVGNTSATGTGTIADNGTLDLNGYSPTINGLSGSGTVTSAVSGSVTLTVGNGNASSTFSGVIQDGSGTVALAKSGSGTETLTGTNTYSGGTTISAGTVQVGNATSTGSLGSGGVVDNAALAFFLTGTSTFANAISGSGTLTQSGNGSTLIVTGSNSYSGTTTINGLATLQVGNAGTSGTLGSGTVTAGSVISPGSLVFDRSDSVTVGNTISAYLNLTQQGSGTLILTGSNTYSGTTTISGGTLQVGSGGTAGSIGSGSVTDNANLAYNRSDAVSLSNVISGSGTVTQQGSGTLTVTGTNTYSGGTTINSGSTLQVGNTSATGTGTVTDNGTLDLRGYSPTINGLSGSGTVTSGVSGSITLTIGSGNASSTFSGVVEDGSGTVALTKSGSGTETFTGTNTYTGGTTISAGTVQVGNNTSTGSLSSGAVVDNAALVYYRSGSTTVANAISGSGTVTQQGSGTLILTGSNSYSGGTTISGGTLQVGSSGTSGSIGSGNVTDNASLAYNRSDAVSLSNVISGSGSVTQQGSGTLTLTGNNTFSGGTTINSGSTLQMGNTSATGSGTITDNGTLDLRGYSPTINGLSGSGTVTSGVSGSVTLTVGNGNASSTFSGVIQDGSGTVALTKTGSGTETLSGTNTYTGGTTISSGTLQLGNSSATGTGSVTVNATLDLNGYSPTLNGLSGSGTVTSGVAGSVTLTVGNSNASSTFSGVAQDGSGTVALTKIGSGTLTLTGTNTYSGGTTISAGTVQVGNNTSTGTQGTGAVVDNAALVFYRSSTATIANTISGSGTVTQTGTGTLILSGTNTYSGGTAVDSGSTLRWGNTSATGTGTVTDNGTLDLRGYSPTINGLSGSGTVTSGVAGSVTLTVGNGNANSTFSGVVEDGSGTVALTKSGSGTLTLTGANTYTGGTTISAGTVQVGNNSSTGSLSSGAVVDNAALVFYRSGTVTVANTISGSGTVTQSGSGTLILTGTNTYSGGTTIDSGITLQLGNTSATGTGSVTANGSFDLRGYSPTINGLSGSGTVTSGVSGSVTLTVGNGNASSTFSGVMQDGSGTVALTKSGSGTLTLTGTNTYTGGTTISAGTIQVGNNTSTGSLSSGAVVDNAALVYYRSGSTTVANAISGSGTLTQQGSGTLILTGSNSYSGGTTISGGTLQVGNGSSSGSLGSGTVVDNAALVFDLSGTQTVANAISGTGTLTQAGSTLILTGANSYSGTTTINGLSTLQIGSGGTSGTLGSGTVTAGSISSLGQLAFDRSDDITVSNTISGYLHVTQQGSGAVELSGTNTYSGGTSIDSGTVLQAGSSSTVTGSGSVTIDGTLDLNGYSPTFNGLSGDGTITSGTSGSVTVTVGDGNASSTFAGVIEDGSGTVALTKVGTGTVILTGDSTYSGDTTISAGTLQVGDYSSTGSVGGGDIVDNSSLVFSRSGTTTIANAISGSGSLTLQEYGFDKILILTGNNTYSGETTIYATCTLQIGNGGTTGTLGTGQVNIYDQFGYMGTLAFDRSNSLTVGSDITGRVAVIQQGSGDLTLEGDISGVASVSHEGASILTLSGANTYSGGTTIESGSTLQIGSETATGRGAVALDGTLDLDGFNATIGKLVGAGTVTSGAAGGTLSVGNNVSQAYTFSGIIEDGSGTVALTKLGIGTLTLSGDNTYSGDTTISAGTLKVGDDDAIPSGSGHGDVIVNGTLDLNGHSLTLNGLSGSGNVTSGVAGTITLTAGDDDRSSTYSGVIEDGDGTLSLTKIGGGVLTVTGINTFSGDTTISDGILSFDLDGLGSGDIVFDDGTLRWANANTEDVSSNFAAIGTGKTAILDTNGNDVTLAHAITGAGSLSKIGDGTLELSGANSYTGTTTISQGAIAADTIVVDGGTSSLGNAASAVVLGDASHQGQLSYRGDTATYTRGFTVNAGGGEIDTTVGGHLLTISTAGISNSGALVVGGAGNTSIGSVISGTGSLTKTGSGTLTLSGANTYTGTTSIYQGTIAAGAIVVGGGNSNLGNATSAVVLGDATHRGVLSYSGSTATYTRGFSVAAGGGEIDTVSGSETLTIGTGGISASGLLTIGGSGNTSIAEVISGSGSLTKTGSGTLTLSGDNTYGGGTTISAGTLKVGDDDALPSGTDRGGVVINSTLDLNGHSITLNGMSGSGTVTSGVAGSVTLSVGDDDQTATYSGVVEDGAGTVALAKIGAGTQTLTGTNTYSGDTTISDGTLSFDTSGLGSGDLVFDGGVLQWAGGNTEDISSGFAAIASGKTAILDTYGNDVTLSDVIAGLGDLRKIGLGTLTLSGANTYADGTTVDAGSLQFETSAVPTTGSITINAGGTLNAAGAYADALSWLGSGKIDTASTGTLALTDDDSSSIAMGSYTALYLGAAGTFTYSGAITPAGGSYRFGGGGGVLEVSTSLADSGGTTGLEVRGDVILSGTNTYSGDTTLSGGELSIDDDDQIGGASSSIVFNGGTLKVTGTTLTNLDGHTVNWSSFDGGLDIDAAGNTFTVSQNLAGSGGLTKLGAGKLVLSGTNTYSGNTIVSAGTLMLDDEDSLPSGSGKGNVVVDGTLDLNRLNVSVNGLSGSGTVTTGIAGTVTLTVGGNDQTSDFAGTIENGDGVVELTKIGAGTLTLSGNSTYTGVTDVQAGTLVLNGNLASEVTDHGGAVAGWFFRDPDLAAAVRKALGMPADAILTQNDIAELTSLYADSNLISDLKGLENATNLVTLSLVPTDSSIAGQLAASQYSASLQWLSGLTNLKSVTLQDTGITDGVLETLGDPPALETLDVRYNVLEVVPEVIADLSSLSTLYVYGNADLASDPRAGLANLAGKLIKIDLAPDHPERATTVAELAAAFYSLPIMMYEYLVNTIEYQPYQGAMKGPTAVLQTKTGNDWDTNSLLAGLFVEGGVLEATGDPRTQNFRYVSGRVYLSLADAADYFGAADVGAVEQIVDNAHLNPEVITDGEDHPIGIVFDHTWLEVRLPQNGNEWVSLDASWKFREHSEAARNMLDEVPWDMDITTADYFAQLRSDTPLEYYEASVRDYLAANDPTVSIADIGYSGPIIATAINSLPAALPYGLWDTDHLWDSESMDPRPVQTFADIPEAMTHRIRITLGAYLGDEYFDSGMLNVSDIALSSLAIRPTLALNDLINPELVLDGQSLVQASTDLNANDAVVIKIEYYQAGGDDTEPLTVQYGNSFFDITHLAGNYYSIMVGARQVSRELVNEQRRELNEASLDYMNGDPLDLDANIGEFLNLESLEYLYQLDTAADATENLTAGVRDVSQIGFGLLTAGGNGSALYRPGTGTTYHLQSIDPDIQKLLPIPVLPETYSIDLGSVTVRSTSILDDTSHDQERLRILYHTSSALESGVWESLTAEESISTIKSFQLASDQDIPILEIAAGTSEGEVESLLSLSDATEAEIYQYVSQGYNVWVPQDETDLFDFHGVGYYVEKPDGTPGPHVITGGLAGGINVGDSSVDAPPEDSPFNIRDIAGTGVNLSNGALTPMDGGFALPGLGVGLQYQSGKTGEPDQPMPDGWFFTYNDLLKTSTDPGDPVDTKIWVDSQGNDWKFAADGEGGYTTPAGIFGTLANNGTGYGFTWTDKTGSVVNFSDANGGGVSRLTSAADRHGNGVSIEYDVNGHIDTVTDLVTPSRFLEFSYIEDRVSSVTDFTDREWTYHYDTNGRLDSVTSPSDGDTLEAVVHYEYYTDSTLDGLLKSVTDANGNVTEYTYYANRRAFEIKDSAGNTRSIAYDLLRSRAAVTDERGAVSYHTFNTVGNPIEDRQADRTTTTYVWEDNLLKSVTDAFGQTESYDYDEFGNLISLTDRVGNVTTYEYTDYGNIKTVTRENGEGSEDDQVTEYRYIQDGLSKDDKLQEVEDAEGNITRFTYAGADGARGLPDTVTKPEGTLTGGDDDDFKTTFTYNAAGQVLTVTTRSDVGVPVTISFAYDDQGRILTSTDGNEAITTNTYDLLGHLLTQTRPDPDGVGGNPAPVTSYVYDAAGNLLSSTLTSATPDHEASFTYDSKNRVIQATNPDGTYRTWQYDQAGNVIVQTDELGRVTRFTYDALNRLITTIRPDGGVVRIAYDGGGRVVATTDPLGYTTRNEYDALNRLTKTTDALGGETSYAYDDAGYLHTVTDALDNVTTYTYDKLGQLHTVTLADPDGDGDLESPVTTYAYDANGNLISMIDPLEFETTYEYDELGRLKTVTQPDPDGDGDLESPVIHYAYDGAGNLVSVIDAMENETITDYDALGRKIRVTGPDPDGDGDLESPVTQYAYDSTGNLLSITDPADRVTTFEYNLLGRQIKVTGPDPDGVGELHSQVSTSVYDAVGNLLSATNAQGNTTRYAYDSANRLISQTDDLGAETTYSYDANGNLLALTDPEHNTTTWAYDALGRMTQETNELSATRYFEYDAVGNLKQTTDRDGRVTQYVYDNLYRLKEENWKDGASTIRTFSYEYDAAGQLLSATDPAAEYDYVYDGLGRLITETQTLSGLTPTVVLSAQYDANGNRLQLAASIGGTDDYVNDYLYDALNRLTRVTQQGQAGNTVAEKRIDLAYDAAGQYDTISRFANLAGTQLVATGTYGYDLAGRLTSLAYTKGMTTLVGYNWSFDSAGRMTQYVNSIDGTVNYANDSTGQLTGADYDYQADETYEYDANGNRVNNGFQTGANNRLLSDGTYAYTYDGEGNRTARFVDADHSGTITSGDTDISTYGWDYRNRLAEVDHFANFTDYDGEDPDQVVGYAYDYQNRLIEKVFDSDGDGTQDSSTIYVHDGDQVALQFEHTGTGDAADTDLAHRYLFNPQAVDQLFADEQVTSLGSAGAVLWALTDQLNTVRDLATYDSGLDATTIANHRVFDAFGKLMSQTHPEVAAVFGYTGRLYDADTELQNNLDRWYDAQVGRWASEDPIGFRAGDANIVRYVSNHSLTMVDPNGHGGLLAGLDFSGLDLAAFGKFDASSHGLLDSLGKGDLGVRVGRALLAGEISAGVAVGVVIALAAVADAPLLPIEIAAIAVIAFASMYMSAMTADPSVPFYVLAAEAVFTGTTTGISGFVLPGGGTGASLAGVGSLGGAIASESGSIVAGALSTWASMMTNQALANRQNDDNTGSQSNDSPETQGDPPDNPAHNAADFARYKDQLRTSMSKPHVSNGELARYMDELYRPNAQIGSGSTAAAVRHELATGGSVGGRTHTQKAQDMITNLQRWLKNNPDASHGDRAAAENVIQDMINALGGN